MRINIRSCAQSMNIVVLDYGRLPADVDFPPLEANRYGWEQYPELTGEQVSERCWRADVIVNLGSVLDGAQLAELGKLRLLIVADDPARLLPLTLLRERGVRVEHLSCVNLDDRAAAQDLCNRIAACIDGFMCEAPG
jgi:hypothetical protein